MSDDPQQTRIEKARASFSGRALTDAQLDESVAIADIIERGIRRSGTFREKLTDYAHAFARNEQFDAMRGETIIRDTFKAVHGQSMNEMREKLMEREEAVRDLIKPEALDHANRIEPLIRDGETMPFYQAYDREGVALAQKHAITETGAKSFMKEAYRDETGRSLYDDGKAAEREHHLPKREAEKRERAAAQRDQKPASENEAGPARSFARTR